MQGRIWKIAAGWGCLVWAGLPVGCTPEARTEVFHIRYDAGALERMRLSESDADLLTQRILDQYEAAGGRASPQTISTERGSRTFHLADYAQWKKEVDDPAGRQEMLKNGYKPWIVRVK